MKKDDPNDKRQKRGAMTRIGESLQATGGILPGIAGAFLTARGKRRDADPKRQTRPRRVTRS